MVRAGPTPSATPRPPQEAAKHAAWGKANLETYIDIEMARRKYQCLIDTGCDPSLLPNELAKNKDLLPVNIIVTAATGSPIRILGSTKVQFSTKEMLLEADVILTQYVQEVMLG